MGRNKPNYVRYGGNPQQDTIATGTTFVQANATPIGCICPCCNRINKLYPRTLNNTIARMLFGLVEAFQESQDWVHVRNIPWGTVDARAGGGDLGKLVLWELAIEEINDDPDKGRSGFWKPTPWGLAFLHNQLRVPRIAFVYQNEVQSYSTDTVSIVEALGKLFSYAELMEPITV